VRDIFTPIIALSLVAVLVALGFGLFSLFKGGDYARSNSNKFMRLRVLAQFIAVIVLVAAFYFRSRGH
jgi:Na+-driven multidrug efflux pump